MIPSVFISSTVEDLHYVRDAVRSTIEELCYRPVMSDYGEIGYIGEDTAEEACYASVKECDIVILIVGKRVGSPSKTDPSMSVTEKEHDVAVKSGKLILTLVENEVLEYKKVFDKNHGSAAVKFPGMNEPAKTFAFMSRIRSSESRNGIIPFTRTTDIRSILKQQIAILVYNLIHTKSVPTQSSLNDILSEVKTIREAMSKKALPDVQFLAAVRFLIDDANVQFKQFVQEVMHGPVETWIPKIIEAPDIGSFLKLAKMTVEVRDIESNSEFFKNLHLRRVSSFCPMPYMVPAEGEKALVAHYALIDEDQLIINQIAFDYFNAVYKKLKRQIELAG